MSKSNVTLNITINTLKDKYPIIKTLHCERVFDVLRGMNDPEKVMILEQCDEYYGMEFTKEEVEQIGNFFIELSKNMEF